MVAVMSRTRATIVLVALILGVFSLGRASADVTQRAATRPAVTYTDVTESILSYKPDRVDTLTCDAGRAANLVLLKTGGDRELVWEDKGPTKTGGWKVSLTAPPESGDTDHESIGYFRLVCVR